jgi:RimJ/RimL family protein N-acetyltransferase
MKIIIQDDTVQMVHTEKRDLPFVLESEQAQENVEYIGQWSFEQHQNALNDADILHLIIKNSGGCNIGYAIIKGLTNQNDSVELMRIVITEKGRGYGKITLALLKKWCFEVRKAHRFWLDVRETNVRAQYVYKAQGFVTEGILRECIKVKGIYHSLVVMSILSHDYTAL